MLLESVHQMMIYKFSGGQQETLPHFWQGDRGTGSSSRVANEICREVRIARIDTNIVKDMNTKKLIEEVLLDLGNNKSLTDVSSKIQIIVRLLGDEKLKSWYTCEFVTGYKNQELPDYRISQAADIQANYLVPHGFGAISFKGQTVPVMNLGIEKYKEIMSVRINDTISAIIGYSMHPEDISMSLTPYELAQVQKVLGEAHIQSVHKVLSPSTFQTIIDNVQGRIIDMFMDLNDRGTGSSSRVPRHVTWFMYPKYAELGRALNQSVAEVA